MKKTYKIFNCIFCHITFSYLMLFIEMLLT